MHIQYLDLNVGWRIFTVAGASDATYPDVALQMIKGACCYRGEVNYGSCGLRYRYYVYV